MFWRPRKPLEQAVPARKFTRDLLEEDPFCCYCLEYLEATDDEFQARTNFYTESLVNVRQATGPKLQHNKLSGPLTILLIYCSTQQLKEIQQQHFACWTALKRRLKEEIIITDLLRWRKSMNWARNLLSPGSAIYWTCGRFPPNFWLIANQMRQSRMIYWPMSW